MKGKLKFDINLKHDRKSYAPLTAIGSHCYDYNKKMYVWTFPVSKVKEVMSITGKPILFDLGDGELISNLLEKKAKSIVVGPKQGEGFIKVQIHPHKPNCFVVTTVRERTPQNTIVSFDTVLALWRVISRQPLNKKVLTHTVAENYCNELKIVAFNTHKDNTFNWKYFSGHRKYYLIFYSSIKVLSHYGLVEHVIEASKSGITKIQNKWDFQTELS
jgi:hypothetical protein